MSDETGIQQTLESLNRDLRAKVEKIAEQQRRILLLQDQLMDRGGASQVVAVELAGRDVFAPIKGSRTGDLAARFDVVLGVTPEA